MLRVWVPDLRPKGIMKARKQRVHQHFSLSTGGRTLVGPTGPGAKVFLRSTKSTSLL